MNHALSQIGELISLAVAVSWTLTALFSEIASKRMGSLPLNLVRITMALLFLGLTLWLTLGVPYPLYADGPTWLWLCLSGFVGYVLGDYCLFRCYILIGARFGQLFMTLAPPSAAIMAWILLGERMTWLAVVGMLITITGISLSVLSRKHNDDHKSRLFSLQSSLSTKGMLFGIGAGMGQGIGLVLSKVGMQHYEASILSHGITDMATYTVTDALIPLSLSTVMPFASTMIRATMGIIGFSIALFLFSHHGGAKLVHAVRDRRAMLFTLLATIFGPFVGVSLSLMATLYTNTGVAQTIMSLTPVLIILPAYLWFRQPVTLREIIGAIISVAGVALFFSF